MRRRRDGQVDEFDKVGAKWCVVRTPGKYVSMQSKILQIYTGAAEIHYLYGSVRQNPYKVTFIQRTQY